MQLSIPWLRHSFLSRRRLDRIFLDIPDALNNRIHGRKGLPPYSLRAFVGGSRDFFQAGYWFREDLYRLNLIPAGAQILDIGCGCGRLARPLAVDPHLRQQGIGYTGMDIDAKCVSWCQHNITSLNPQFRFYQADCYSPSYNREGGARGSDYCFPHPNQAFDLILLTSVFTHVLPVELTHYLSEIARLLTPDGVAYVSMFLYPTLEEAAEGTRHGIKFPFARDSYAVNREDFPTNAVAYREDFVLRQLQSRDLRLLGPIRYGVQDTMLLTRAGTPQPIELRTGWYPMEQDQWRWTARRFEISLPPSNSRRLRFRFTLPDSLQTGITRVSASLNGLPLATCEYRNSGDHFFLADLPGLLGGETVHFQVDTQNPTTASDARQLGVQVKFARECGGTIQILNPIALY